MSAPVVARRPTRGGWEPLIFRAAPPNAEGWQRKGLRVLSELGTMSAPDGSGDVLPTWLVSVSRAGASMPTDRDLARVRRDFRMEAAEEDNHVSGIARDLFLVVDRTRRVDCECKAGERVIVRADGYRYSVEGGPR